MAEDFIQTYTGKRFHFLNPYFDEIDILDIAHALSNVCRFNGHCNRFYSVAQHSIIMSNLIEKEYALYALLHDASEAYIFDLLKPIKEISELSNYRKIEKDIQNLILFKYNLLDLSIIGIEKAKRLDIKLLATEARQLGLMTEYWETYNIEPLNIKIKPMNPKKAENMFLKRFNELYNI